LQQGRSQPNIIATRKREHSRKPDEQYELFEGCSWGPRLELFSRGNRKGWTCWGNQADEYNIAWETYKNHSQAEVSDGVKRLPLAKIASIESGEIKKKKAK
jgi:N6-adenosine-specific RNA methylase IME4